MDGTVTQGLKTGIALTAASGASMMISSAIERGSPWAGVNAMASATGVRRRIVEDGFDSEVTPLGLSVLAGGLLLFGIADRGLLGPVRRRSRLAAGALSAAGGYALDRFVLPDWVLPNFRRKMGPAGTLAKYVALGLASAAVARRPRRKRLAGKRIAVLAADGFEQVELTRPVRALRAEGAEVEVISLRRGKIVGMNVNIPGRRVRVDRKVESANPHDYDGLFVPGGFINPDLLRQSQAARDFVRAFDAAGRPVAVICHGPWLLASAGLLAGRRITSWPGIRDDMVNAGGVWQDEAVVRDGNLISSRGPMDLRAFTRAMVDLFSEREAPAALAEVPAMPAASAPQRERPPALALAGTALLPKVRRVARVVGALAVLALVMRPLLRASPDE